MHFTNFGLHEHIVKAITEMGFLSPTEIQKETIPLLLGTEGDFIGLAQTGTGKTAAFGLPLVHKIDIKNNKTQAIILCPTRELCLQITTELIKYGKYMSGLSIVPIYGGTDIRKQMVSLKRGAHIVVGTPGRILDHLDRRTLDLSTVDIVILDEADEMLTMGFQEDINAILSNTINKKRTWLFSATMPPMVGNIAKKYMTNPATVTIGSKNSSAQNITHAYCVTRRHDRYAALRRLIDFYPEFFGIVFCRTRSEAKELSDKLMHDGYNADALHGDLSQSQRDTVMQKLRHHKLSIVIATDVAARGIDVNDLTHVIHYNLPEKFENYTHRSGRTARAGKSGVSISLLSGGDVRRLKQIERVINTPIEQMQVPDGNAICAKQIEQCIQRITQASIDKAIEPYVSQILEKISSSISKEHLVSLILGKELNKIMRMYKDAPDINDNDAHTRSGSYTSEQPSYNRSRRPDSRQGGNRGFGGDRRRYGNSNNYSSNNSSSNRGSGYKKYQNSGASHSAPADRGA
jgi:ATP-dependent RNA helicase DeaD